MRYLLDTHIAVWIVTSDPKLPRTVTALLDGGTTYVSAASVWEIAIKSALRRGHFDDMPVSGNQAIRDFVAAGMTLLNIEPDDAAAIDGLPPIHGDPFDRLLVAQAARQGMFLVTHERKLADYGSHITLV